MSTSDNITPSQGTRSPSNGEAQHNETPPPTPPYNFYFAIASVGVGAAAYVLTMLIFREVIGAPKDVAIVSGALGVLFTLIGTIESKANERTQEANKRALDESDKARKASLMVNPKDPEVEARELL
jgi:hypothetical protein